jgi:hypothetical protein
MRAWSKVGVVPGLVALVALVALLLQVTPSRAGDADRADLLAAIDTRVRALAADLTDLADAADARGLDAAGAHLDELDALVGQLALHGAKDGRAADVVAHYPGFVAEARAAVGHLRTLKAGQHAADDAPARCAKDEAALIAPATAYRARPTDAEKTYQQLTASAAAIGARWTTRLAELATLDQAMTTSAASHCTAADAYWMDVSGRANAAAAAIVAAWTEHHDAAVAACAAVALGARHPQVAPLLDDLGHQLASVHAEAADLTRDLGAWVATLGPLRARALADRQALRDVLCTGRSDDLEEHTRDLADHLARELATAHAAAAATADALRPRIAALGKNPLAPHHAATLRAGAALLDHLRADLAGRDNPALRRRLAASRARRTAVYRGLRCALRELAISPGDCGGAACHVDCIQVVRDHCTVVEVRPAGQGADAGPEASATTAIDALRSWYARDGADLLGHAPALRACVRDEEKVLDVEAKVATYDLCGGTTAADLGDKLPEIQPAPAP